MVEGIIIVREKVREELLLDRELLRAGCRCPHFTRRVVLLLELATLLIGMSRT